VGNAQVLPTFSFACGNLSSPSLEDGSARRPTLHLERQTAACETIRFSSVRPEKAVTVFMSTFFPLI
jgi:hypothetical protein